MAIRYRGVGPIAPGREHDIVHVLSVGEPAVAPLASDAGGLTVSVADRVVQFGESGGFVEIAASD